MWSYIWFSLFFISACCNFASVRAWLKAKEERFVALEKSVAAIARADALELANKAKGIFARKPKP